ncbi:hypothetical protein [Burkholderia multivorans]|uniref:hypothetical protein n=1 Tax=Burkholderia multivorans TaxID=87883 RepID=UPI000CFF8EE5|nr:hypothetical protein [Burkholderia multivorans]MDN7965578.1 hypothetical protein [Burkholderia multivorans]MDN7998074.1 hypothetical protein [Burkholderia multivorans]PRG29271.1 hypothetical protein C6T62_24290 [Burkholderia multivorans]
MKRLYARFVLWLIRPALDEREEGFPPNKIMPKAIKTVGVDVQSDRVAFCAADGSDCDEIMARRAAELSTISRLSRSKRRNDDNGNPKEVA